MNLPVTRLILGLAMPGDFDQNSTDQEGKAITMLDTFSRKKDAENFAATIPDHFKPVTKGYLSGRLERGWTVLAATTISQRAAYSYHRSWPDAFTKPCPPAALKPYDPLVFSPFPPAAATA